RMRMYGLSERDARDQKASTVIGRLCLTKEVSQVQYDAAVEYLRIYDAYKRAIKAPDALRNSSGGGGDSEETEAYATWGKSVIDKHQGAVNAVVAENSILRNRGCNLVAALDHIVRRDMHFVHMVGDCRLALNALAAHFGLTASANRPTRGSNSTVAVV